jgi:hypothetical protein
VIFRSSAEDVDASAVFGIAFNGADLVIVLRLDAAAVDKSVAIIAFSAWILWDTFFGSRE